MATDSTGRAAVLVLRAAAAALTATTGAIHLALWADGYRDLATIGSLFLLNGVLGCLLAAALLLAPSRRLAPVATVTALFTAGTLGALFLSLTTGLFGFEESADAELVRPTVVVEAVDVLVLTALAVTALGHRHRGR